jgi:Alkylmercury lyase
MSPPHARTGSLHHELCRGIVEEGAIPARNVLQARLRCSGAELDEALDALADAHGVVLHPGTHRVWVIHPFSLAPTPFLVESERRTWWGNCAWCSFGIAVLAGGTCAITSTLAAEREQVQLIVRDGQLNRTDLVVHFPIPMVQAWENVIYTCSTMLLFKDEEHVDEWTARHRMPRGDVQPVSKVLELAKRWYGDYLNPNWTKKTTADARAIFTDVGFTHAVWSLPSHDGRF